MKYFRKSLKYTLRLLLGIIVFLASYALVIFILSRISVNTDDQDPKQEVAVYIKSNGVHTDIVVPVRNDIKDWTAGIKPEYIRSKDTTMGYIGFGWGDRGFYLNTPEWADLKVSTACNAAFYLGSSAMHTTFFKTMHENQSCVKINISKAEYLKMITYIEDSFRAGQDSRPLIIPNASYGNNDSFYEAKGKYSLFYTCNSWANNVLRASGQKAALWTLTDTGIFYHYQ